MFQRPHYRSEVKVMRILLADGFNSAFEFLGNVGDANVSMSDGALAPAFAGGSTASRALGNGLGVAGAVPGSLSFQTSRQCFRRVCCWKARIASPRWPLR
ncbi:MAG: hypothetical protein U0892_21050 [Pirellulales bacterium]